MKLSGIFPPMITPFKENGEVDYEAFVYNVRKWAQTCLLYTSYYCAGDFICSQCHFNDFRPKLSGTGNTGSHA